MASGTLVLCEHDGGVFKKTAYELLGKAAELGGDVSALVIGDADAASLGAYGAGTVYHATGDVFGAYNTGAWAKALSAAVAASGAAVVLAPASGQGKDFIPRVGARIGAGVVSEVTGLVSDGGKVVGTRPVYAGKAFVSCSVKSDVALFTVRPNSFPAPVAGSGSASVVALDHGASDADVQARVVSSEAAASKVADLTEAERIVAGGRSLKSLEAFDEVIRGLAGSIGATPGASRAAVDAGYAGHGDQVGQTGKVVNPQLYIAAGISGAIQHLAGMRTSKVIVAINKDPEAPIFKHSTYGIVGDLFEICPLLQKEFEAL
ncbi:MAG: electron transfer flavoprotein subunit alpha/FixB family protein [Proteobacteria bacterium]|nr:electron transfer flavoprotein subunit alpha/FixB family protein [Pseudomonadota bacterium]MCP4919585.1 electron transfer flavoprotein subunit alpha/FixB family protein [Pseudomonadota bacterium]